MSNIIQNQVFEIMQSNKYFNRLLFLLRIFGIIILITKNGGKNVISDKF